MKIIKKNVYYCDFCKKKSLRSLKIHEKHCTGNPDRACRLCEGPSIRPIIDEYRRYFKVTETPCHDFPGDDSVNIKIKYFNDFSLQGIIDNDLQSNCPNCILAIIRCLGLNRHYFEGKYKFKYKDALSEWWSEKNKEAELQDYYDSMEL